VGRLNDTGISTYLEKLFISATDKYVYLESKSGVREYKSATKRLKV